MTGGVVADADALRERLVGVVAATLRVPAEQIDPRESFASLGMDSLSAVELAAAIEESFGVAVSPASIHEHPTVASLGHFIEHGALDDGWDERRERLAADAKLPRDITPNGDAGSAVAAAEARCILLTGATGFVGAYLLRELLETTGARVVCLVRPRASRAETLDAVVCNLEQYDLWQLKYSGRIHVAVGNLAAPLLGLAAHEFEALATQIDAVYHAGAEVNWVRGYNALRHGNVLGTRELLRLACRGRPKPFHFISSVSVCHATTAPRTVDEQADMLGHVDALRLGYAQSKCVAEALVRDAGTRGLPVTILRPSLVSGDAARGRSNVDDLTSRFIAGCVHMRAAPDLDWRMDCVPVDDVARAMVHLTRHHRCGIGTWHLAAERPKHWRECVLWMRLRGYDISLVPYREWTDLLRADDSATHPLHALRSFFLHRYRSENGLTLAELFEDARLPRVSSHRTTRALATAGAALTPLDADLLDRYFDDLAAHATIPAQPSRRNSPAATGASPSLLAGCEAALGRSLGALLSDPSTRVERTRLTRLVSEDSIVAELTAWHAGASTGLYRADVDLIDGTGQTRGVRLFVKAKAADARIIDIAEVLGRLASPALGDNVSRFRDHLGFTRGHVRELALYGVSDERLRAYTPAPVLIERDDDQDRWLLALESIDDAAVFNANDPGQWDDPAIEAALVGLASIHSVWYRRDDALLAEPWLPPMRDERQRVAMSPLWTALAEHAWAHSAAWGDTGVRREHERLLARVPSWARRLDGGTRTLIHNDFNPRNIALRPGRGGLRLSAFDWELATIGIPQRDLVELLCFVLPPDASHATITRWIERHRVLLAHSTDSALDRQDWEAGVAAALADFLIDRLASYAMIHRVRPQAFLARVVSSWLNIARRFPWEN